MGAEEAARQWLERTFPGDRYIDPFLAFDEVRFSQFDFMLFAFSVHVFIKRREWPKEAEELLAERCDCIAKSYPRATGDLEAFGGPS